MSGGGGLGGCAASVASAAVIGFDDLQDGVTVQNQYASQGVVFDNAGDLPVVRAVGAGPAESPPNVADISVCSACEFFRPYTTGHFSDGATRQHVSVRVGEFPTTAPDTAVVQLIAYDTGHAVVAQSSPATVSAGAGFHTLLSADSANVDIYSFEITARANLDASKPIGIDNLRFENPSARTPDFALGAAAGVKVLAGSSVGVPISIDRLNGSAGNVQLGVAGLPQGVSSSISPSPAPGSSATLTLTAASDAPRSVVGATITGTPAGTSVGPGAHSRQLSIDVERPFTVRVPPNTVADLSNCRLQVPVSLSRDFSFPGPVDLAVGGLPSGVSASFVPAQATFPAGAASETVMLTLTAPPDLGVTQGPAVVTVTGTSPGRPPSSTTLPCPARAREFMCRALRSRKASRHSACPRRAICRSHRRPVREVPHIRPNPQSTSTNWATVIRACRRGGKTVVRVYAATALSGTRSPARNITAMLHAYDSDTGAPLYANSLYPDQGPNLGARDLRQGADQPTDAQRADPNGAFTFTLPDRWTRRVTYGPFGRTIGHSRSITIRADLLRLNGGPDAVATPDCTSDACQAGSSFALSDIPFESTDTVAYAIAPIAMTSGNAMPPPPPSPVDLFRDAQNFTPLDMTVYPNYLATVDVSDIAARGLDSTAAGHAVLDRVDGFDEHNDTAGYSYGVNEIGARGMEHSYWNYGRAQFRSDAEIADGSNSATGFAHEWFHLLGLPHAGCGDVGENLGPWPPDQMGFIQGVGLDRQTDSGGKGRYRIYFPTASAAIFDFMSYCAGTPWISLHYWNQLIAEHSTGPQARRPAARERAPGRRSGPLYRRSICRAPRNLVHGRC